MKIKGVYLRHRMERVTIGWHTRKSGRSEVITILQKETCGIERGRAVCDRIVSARIAVYHLRARLLKVSLVLKV